MNSAPSVTIPHILQDATTLPPVSAMPGKAEVRVGEKGATLGEENNGSMEKMAYTGHYALFLKLIFVFLLLGLAPAKMLVQVQGESIMSGRLTESCQGK